MGEISFNLLQHDSIPFFPLVLHVTPFFQGHATSLGFLFFFNFFAFPFSQFLIFLLQWLTFYKASLPSKNLQESVIEISNFCHGAAMCSLWKFSLSIFVHISGSVNWIRWSGYHWKDLFLLQKLITDVANFGQRWWSQKWKAKACHGQLQAAQESMG